MKKINVVLSDIEYKALQELFWNSVNCCRSGCVWDECSDEAAKIKDEDEQYNYCDRCIFTTSVASLKKAIFKE